MLNHIVLMGRLTRDPVLRYTRDNKPISHFRLAVDRDYGKPPITDFIDCVAWNATGEFVQKYFSKGSSAVVTGRLQISDYTDKNGLQRTRFEVNVDHVYFGERKQYGEKKEPDATAPSDIPAGEWEDYDQELPWE